MFKTLKTQTASSSERISTELIQHQTQKNTEKKDSPRPRFQHQKETFQSRFLSTQSHPSRYQHPCFTDEETEAELPGGLSKDLEDLTEPPQGSAPARVSSPDVHPSCLGLGRNMDISAAPPDREPTSWGRCLGAGHWSLLSLGYVHLETPRACTTEHPGPWQVGIPLTTEVSCPAHLAHRGGGAYPGAQKQVFKTC